MSTIESGIYQLGKIDQLAALDTPIHRIDPRAKVLTTIVFLFCVVSFGKYELLPLLPFAIFPIVLASEGEMPFGYLGTRLLIASPFALFIGVFNPLLDRAVIGQIGGVDVIAGWVSYASIMLRFTLTTAAALVLICTTGMFSVCMAIERHGRAGRARHPTALPLPLHLRARRGGPAPCLAPARCARSGARAWASGSTARSSASCCLRTYARAQRIYNAMLCRGFDGHVRTTRVLRFAARDYAFILGWSAAFLVFRLYNVPLLLGQIVTGLVS